VLSQIRYNRFVSCEWEKKWHPEIPDAEIGCIPGIHEILRRQGLLEGRWCLDPREELSPGQIKEIDRGCRAYPHWSDDAFVQEHLDDWLD
jgi:hypothetical protein